MAELEISNLSITDDDAPTSNNITDRAKIDAAAAHGWEGGKKYNYLASTGNTHEERNAAALSQRQQELNELRASDPEAFIADVPLWASAGAKYEWSDEYGDVGPEVPELERQLYHDKFINRVGENFSAMTMGHVTVTVESEAKIEPWENSGLHPVMVDNVKLCKYPQPTAIQGYCIPAILKNHDIIAVAQTGSGKTAAYLIPTLSKLMGKAKKLAAPRPNVPFGEFDPMLHGVRAEPLILVIVPTRELAVQIFDEARRLCYRSMLRPCVAYGGGPVREQADDLRRGCDILIASPGRLMDFMTRGSLLSLRRVKYTIIDEADELVGPDWIDEMKTILTGGDNNEDADHRYMMFSATFPKEARQLAKDHLTDDHIRIRVGRIGSTHKTITQNIIWAEESMKRQALFDLLLVSPPARTIIFVNSKKSADFLDDFLYNNGMPSTSIHSDRTQREREDALRSFKSGKTPILVATGVSARGLDVVHVMHVINYDLPSVDHGGIQEYIHRIGRTARIGNEGIATSFYNDRNESLGPALTKVLLECSQSIPDFLEQFKPEEGQVLDFEDESDEEGTVDEGPGVVEDGGWGNGNGATNGGNDTNVPPVQDGGWGNGDGATNGGNDTNVQKVEPEPVEEETAGW